MRKSGRKLIFCVISFVLISSVLAVSTFERRQSGFTVFGRNFFAPNENTTFDIDLFWSSDPDNEEWKNVKTAGNEIPFGSNVLWEPDHSEVRYFKIQNTGSYDFQYNLGIDVPDSETDTLAYIEEHPIGNVIDVFVSRNISDLSSKEYIGTLSECFQWPNILNKTDGNSLGLESGKSDTCALIFTMQHNAGNEYQGSYDENSIRMNNICFKICAGASAEEPEPEANYSFGVSEEQLPNYKNYLYRIGTSNDIAVSEIFSIDEENSAATGSLFAFTAFAADFDPDLLSFEGERISGSGNVALTYKPCTGTYDSAGDYIKKSFFRFSGSGVIKVKMLYGGVLKSEIYLETLTGNNITKDSTSFGTSDVILMDDVSFASTATLARGKTLYGNGFTVNDIRTNTSGTNGFINVTDGTIDNVIINGGVYERAVTSGITNQYYSPGIRITGKANIYNSYISECKYAVSIESGNVLIKNTVITGGAVGNIFIGGGNVTLDSCTTSTSVRGGLTGLGIHVATAACKLKLENSLTQYNWVKQGEAPSNFSSILNGIYSDTNSPFVYTSGNTKYLNMGILFANEGSITESQARQAIDTDSFESKSDYDYLQKTSLGITGTLYSAKNTLGSADMLSFPGYSPAVTGQYYTTPAYSFDFTNKNYKQKVEGDNEYCYYDSTTDTVNISFEKTDPSAHFEWDPMILTVTKYGTYNIGYLVNGEDYTGRKISFADSGDYEIVYTYSDPYQYFYTDGTGLTNPGNGPQYTHTVKINVTAVDPETVIYEATFSYVGTWSNPAKQVITSDNKTYVMPDVSATSDTIGSSTIGGKTVFYPIVTVNATSSNGNTAYSSGNGYYFAPVFNALNITDYNQDTGASQYTYNASSTTWPHDRNKNNGPDPEIFGYAQADGTWSSTCPYGRSLNSQYYKYGSNNNGLCYTTNEIAKDNSASEHLVTYHYVSNDGTTYYYCIYYKFGAMTYSAGGCFAEGTMITMADGTRKPIENVTYDDRILSYNFFTGETEGKSIAILVNHGKDNYKILNLEFSDGTSLRLIADHGVFDYTLNDYVYMTEENYKDYIGHKFVSLKENGRFKKVKLTGASVTYEYTAAYSITSAQNSNAFAQNMLTVAPPDEFYNWIDMGGKMRYDKKQFDADVEKYGLYDYSVFEDYVSYEEYVAFNGPYLKVAVEKGKFTFDDIIRLIELYGSFMK